MTKKSVLWVLMDGHCLGGDDVARDDSLRFNVGSGLMRAQAPAECLANKIDGQHMLATS